MLALLERPDEITDEPAVDPLREWWSAIDLIPPQPIDPQAHRPQPRRFTYPVTWNIHEAPSRDNG